MKRLTIDQKIKLQYYTEKFISKMGSKTPTQTAMGWAEGANLGVTSTNLLKKNILKYLNNN